MKTNEIYQLNNTYFFNKAQNGIVIEFIRDQHELLLVVIFSTQRFSGVLKLLPHVLCWFLRVSLVNIIDHDNEGYTWVLLFLNLLVYERKNKGKCQKTFTVEQ